MSYILRYQGFFLEYLKLYFLIYNMIGREKERNKLLKLYAIEDPQFVAIYGRRRVGKTYLVTNTFEDKFTFRHSGLSPEEYNSDKAAARLQLDHFYNSLKLYGLE